MRSTLFLLNKTFTSYAELEKSVESIAADLKLLFRKDNPEHLRVYVPDFGDYLDIGIIEKAIFETGMSDTESSDNSFASPQSRPFRLG